MYVSKTTWVKLVPLTEYNESTLYYTFIFFKSLDKNNIVRPIGYIYCKWGVPNNHHLNHYGMKWLVSKGFAVVIVSIKVFHVNIVLLMRQQVKERSITAHRFINYITYLILSICCYRYITKQYLNKLQSIYYWIVIKEYEK